jgi:RimJ/RimL family protein N-acetyltransferase
MEVRTIQESDMEWIRVLRNGQTSVLRQKNQITPNQQITYYKNEIAPDFDSYNPKSVLFTFWLKGKIFGYGGFVHIDWNIRSAEISFLIQPEWNDSGRFERVFLDFQAFLARIGALEMGLTELTSEAFEIPERSQVIGLLERAGFAVSGKVPNSIFHDGDYVDSVLHSKRLRLEN